MGFEGRPEVSVLIAAHNAEGFIEETIHSALAQKSVHIEVIVIDDGSSDRTVDRVRCIRDSRLQLFCQNNRGPGEALNAGLRQAEGQYTALLDHDDLWLENKLRSHIDYMERHPLADLTFSWSGFIDEAGRRLSFHSRRCRGAIPFRRMVIDYVIGTTSSVVARTESLRRAGLFDPSFRMYYDEDLVLRVARLQPKNIHAVPEELTLYRRHSGQMSRDWRKMKSEWNRLVEKLRALAPEDMSGIEPRAQSNMHRYFSYLAYESGDYRTSASLLANAFRFCPCLFVFDLRNWRMGAGCLSALLLPKPVDHYIRRLARIRC